MGPVGNTQVVHSTYRENRNNRTNRMSEVHGGDTAVRMQLTRADEYRVRPDAPGSEPCLRREHRIWEAIDDESHRILGFGHSRHVRCVSGGQEYPRRGSLY